jgi:hypothetical protein
LRDALERGALPRARTTLIALVAAAAALLALIATPAADAKPGKAKNAVPFSVMTRNIFLGADLSPALNSTSAGEFIAANGAILREVDATNFPLRAEGLAKEITSKKPALVGIQEGAWWRTGDTPGPPVQGDSDAFTAVTTRQDFLQLLLDQLNSKTNKKFKGYRLAVVGTEFDFEAPADYDNNPSTGLLGGEIQGRLTMRDAILVRKGGAEKANNPQTGHFSSLFTPTISGIQVPVTRGWVSLDASAKRGKGKDVIRKKFHFVNSHFEAFDDETQHPSIRAQQAAELASGPASNPKSIILGDFNSDVPGLLRPQPVHVTPERVRPPGRSRDDQHGQAGQARQVRDHGQGAGERDLRLRSRRRLQQAEDQVTGSVELDAYDGVAPSGGGAVSIRPHAKLVERGQRLLAGAREVVGCGESAQPGDRLADLLEVGLAAVAPAEVRLGLHPLGLGELSLDQVGHQLHEFLTRHLVHDLRTHLPASASK